jgi:hypothetical protein
MSTTTVQPGISLFMAPGLDAVTDGEESPYSGLLNVRAAFAGAFPHLLQRAAAFGKAEEQRWKAGLTAIARDAFVLNQAVGGRGIRLTQDALRHAVGEDGHLHCTSCCPHTLSDLAKTWKKALPRKKHAVVRAKRPPAPVQAMDDSGEEDDDDAAGGFAAFNARRRASQQRQ